MSDNLGDFTEVLIRHALPGDIERVVREWLSSFRNSRWAGVIPNNLYKKVYAETIRQLINRGARIDVACYEKKPELLLGFICYEHTPRDKILHYVFVRSDYRQNGIGKLLLSTAGFSPGQPYVYTFRTPDSSFFPGGSHIPALARRKEAHKEDAEPRSSGELN